MTDARDAHPPRPQRGRRKAPVSATRLTLLSAQGEAHAVAAPVIDLAAARAKVPRPAGAPTLRSLPVGPDVPGPGQLSLGLRPSLRPVSPPRPPWADAPAVVLPPGLRTFRDTLDPGNDLPGPDGPAGHIESAIAVLRAAAQTERVSRRGDALLVAMEHLAQALGDTFDPATARAHLEQLRKRL